MKVHPEFLAGQKLPPQLVGKDIWDERYQDIRGFERHLARNGTLVRKFFLNVSQRRAEASASSSASSEPEKNWKFSAGRRARARALERLHGGVRDDDPRDRRRRTRRGTSCRPTTSGTRASSSRPRSSTRWPRSISTTRSSTRRSWPSSRPRARRCSAKPDRAPMAVRPHHIAALAAAIERARALDAPADAKLRAFFRANPSMGQNDRTLVAEGTMQWADPERIVSIDPWGACGRRGVRRRLEQGYDMRPTIAVTKAHIQLPEMREGDRGRSPPARRPGPAPRPALRW